MCIRDRYNSAFKNTNLDAYLKSQGIQDLIIVGMQSEYCIDTSIKVAFELGYSCLLYTSIQLMRD